jgi:hypothetical protein
MNRPFAIAILLFGTSMGFAEAQSPTTPPICPRGTAYANSRGDGDGCLGAPKGKPDNITLFQRPDFFDRYAAQSGQTYKTRPPWNVAGVDYPVGIPKDVTLKDPATAPLPAGCNYNATGNSIGGPLMRCSNGVLDIEGYDFSGTLVHPGSHGCVDFSPGASNPKIILKYNYFAINSACFGPSNGGYAVQVFTGNTNLILDNNVFDYSPPKSGAGTGFRPISIGQGNVEIKYNAFINLTGDPVVGSASGNLLAAYNYVENYVFDVTNQGHGEFIGLTGSGTQAQTYYFYNTILQGRAGQAGSTTTTIWLANGVGGITYADAEVLNNTTVVNLSANKGQDFKISEAALVNMNATHTATQIRDNYTDNIGSYYYSIAAGVTCTNPVAWSGNFELRGGGTVSKAIGFSSYESKGC